MTIDSEQIQSIHLEKKSSVWEIKIIFLTKNGGIAELKIPSAGIFNFSLIEHLNEIIPIHEGEITFELFNNDISKSLFEVKEK